MCKSTSVSGELGKFTSQKNILRGQPGLRDTGVRSCMRVDVKIDTHHLPRNAFSLHFVVLHVSILTTNRLAHSVEFHMAAVLLVASCPAGA